MAGVVTKVSPVGNRSVRMLYRVIQKAPQAINTAYGAFLQSPNHSERKILHPHSSEAIECDPVMITAEISPCLGGTSL